MSPLKLLSLGLALSITSCGGTRTKSPQQKLPQTQISQSDYQILLSNAAAQQAIIGDVPEAKRDALPTSVWFTVGNAKHLTSDLVDLAIERITKEEGKPPYDGALAQVVFRNDGSETLAEVTIGSGIGRLYWTITFDKNMQILSYNKGIGVG